MKRSRALRDLSDDHHAALVLAQRCKRSVAADFAGGAWERARAEFARDLEPHFSIEERVLLPALEAAGEGQLAERTRREHAALRTAIANPAPSGEALRDFGTLLERHVRFEEREMFGVAEARLSAAALEAVAAACRSLRAARSGTAS